MCYKYGSIGRDYVFLNNSVDTTDGLNRKLSGLLTVLQDKASNDSSDCVDIILSILCYDSFPLCDYSSSTPVPRKVYDATLFSFSCSCILLFCCRSAGHTVKKYVQESVEMCGEN